MTGPRLAVLGGTGAFGLGLAWRLARSGATVVIGSRDRERAAAAARRIRSDLVPGATQRVARPAGDLAVSGMTNRAAAAAGDVVFLCVPFASQQPLLEEVGAGLDGKLVICCAVIWPPGSRPETSAAEEAERTLLQTGVPKVRVAAAFQTIAAATLRRAPGRDPTHGSPDGPPDGLPDVLVFADAAADRAAAATAAAKTGLRAVPIGPLRGARAAEAAVGLLMQLNRGPARHAGLRVTGLEAGA